MSPLLGTLVCPAKVSTPSLICRVRRAVLIGAMVLPVPLRSRLPGPALVKPVAAMALEMAGVLVVPSAT